MKIMWARAKESTLTEEEKVSFGIRGAVMLELAELEFESIQEFYGLPREKEDIDAAESNQD